MFPFRFNVENSCCLCRINLWAANVYFKCYDNLSQNSAKMQFKKWRAADWLYGRYSFALATITNAGRNTRSCSR
jgi:hypothetical protein